MFVLTVWYSLHLRLTSHCVCFAASRAVLLMRSFVNACNTLYPAKDAHDCYSSVTIE